ncbi:MAG TPA: hypothetical protein VET30_04750 [Pseudoxanthomonas sp.]|nr:hypothetical protein [Pseudoxanthomonas sp.]
MTKVVIAVTSSAGLAVVQAASMDAAKASSMKAVARVRESRIALAAASTSFDGTIISTG